MHHQVHNKLGRYFPRVVDMQVYSCGGNLNRLFQMLLIYLIKPLCAVLVLFAQVLYCLVQNLGDIYLYRVVHRELLTGNAHPVTSDSDTLARGLFIDTVSHISLGEGFIITKSRPAVFVFKQVINRLFQKFFVTVLVNTNGQIASNINTVRRVQNQI